VLGLLQVLLGLVGFEGRFRDTYFVVHEWRGTKSTEVSSSSLRLFALGSIWSVGQGKLIDIRRSGATATTVIVG
jgi:hypothetical protein